METGCEAAGDLKSPAICAPCAHCPRPALNLRTSALFQRSPLRIELPAASRYAGAALRAKRTNPAIRDLLSNHLISFPGINLLAADAKKPECDPLPRGDAAYPQAPN